MGIRENLREKPAVTTIAAVLLVLASAAIISHAYWPEKKANIEQALYSDDDGKTWFGDSIFRVAPFDHNGKTAVVAEIYSYDDGSKQFCGYLVRMKPEAKTLLEAALANAKQRNEPPGKISLYQDHNFMQRNMEVKLPGANQSWIDFNDPKAQKIFEVHSPDGSTIDQVLVY
jgi:hypothetical protein